jgi:arylsulfatase A-like enzyme
MTAGPRPGEVAFKEYFLTKEMAAYRQAKGDKRARGSKASAMGRERVKPEYCYESWLADQCVSLLEKNKDRNFMITYSVSPPHAPWICPDPYYDMYDPARMPLPVSVMHRPEAYRDESSAQWGREMGEANLREYLRCYYGQVTMMDAFLGRILDALKRLGLEEDTLVVYTSDHGDMQAAHNMAGKSVSTFYDELLRVPLVIRYPRGIEAGNVFGCSASSVDVMPTLLDYAGIEIPASVQGRSLRPYIEGKVADRFDAAYCGRGSGVKENFGRMVRTLQAKYTYFGDGRQELFDLTKDPHEMKDVAWDPQYRPLLEKMHGMLLAHSERTEDPALGKMKR